VSACVRVDGMILLLFSVFVSFMDGWMGLYLLGVLDCFIITSPIGKYRDCRSRTKCPEFSCVTTVLYATILQKQIRLITVYRTSR